MIDFIHAVGATIDIDTYLGLAKVRNGSEAVIQQRMQSARSCHRMMANHLGVEPMGRDELLEVLCTLFPAFRSYWLANDNYFRNTGDYTSHGICACFSHYFSEFLCQHDDAILAQLFAFIEFIIADDNEGLDATANAMGTCFLENIAGTASGKRVRKFMGESSRCYFDSRDKP